MNSVGLHSPRQLSVSVTAIGLLGQRPKCDAVLGLGVLFAMVIFAMVIFEVVKLAMSFPLAASDQFLTMSFLVFWAALPAWASALGFVLAVSVWDRGIRSYLLPHVADPVTPIPGSMAVVCRAGSGTPSSCRPCQSSPIGGRPPNFLFRNRANGPPDGGYGLFVRFGLANAHPTPRGAG